MSLLGTAIAAVQLLVAVIWIGAAVFVTIGVLPLAMAGKIGPDPLRTLFAKLTLLTRLSVLVLVPTGGFLLYRRLGDGSLLTTVEGLGLLGVVVLWVLVAVLVEFVTRRMDSQIARGRLRGPAREYRYWLYAISLLGLLSVGVRTVLTVFA